MGRPNLFSFATSELSQDAFLCWLLAWAEPDRAEVDGELHQLGQAFVTALFRVAGIDRPDGPSAITIHRQLEKVDIVAFVGTRHVVLIEDKVDSRQHSDQLRRYPEVIGEKSPHRTQVRVYVTTGDQDDLHNVRDAGWAVMRRIDLLNLLCHTRSENAILVDFVTILSASSRPSSPSESNHRVHGGDAMTRGRGSSRPSRSASVLAGGTT